MSGSGKTPENGKSVCTFITKYKKNPYSDCSMGREGNSPIPLERCLWHRAAASPFHSGPRKADVHRTSCTVSDALTAFLPKKTPE